MKLQKLYLLTQSLMHKNTKLTPVRRREIYNLWLKGAKITHLADQFMVTRKIIRRVIKRAKRGDFTIHKSINNRFRDAFYGLKHLSKTEKKIKGKLARKARRYEKDYPGEMVHFDSKRMPRIKGEDKNLKQEYLFVAIDDYSRHLFADIMPDKSMESSGIFLETMIEVVPYRMDCAYSDNGKEFKGTPEHDFVWVCNANGIEQQFTRVRRPQTNGKAERVIRTLLEECLRIRFFSSRKERRQFLQNYVHFYNTERLHTALKNGKEKLTPCQALQMYLDSKLDTTL